MDVDAVHKQVILSDEQAKEGNINETKVAKF